MAGTEAAKQIFILPQWRQDLNAVLNWQAAVAVYGKGKHVISESSLVSRMNIQSESTTISPFLFR